MKANSTIYSKLKVASIIIGVLVIITSFTPGVMEVSRMVKFSFDVANFFLWGFLIGASIMVTGTVIFDFLDNKFN